jgi:hypothetical protein
LPVECTPNFKIGVEHTLSIAVTDAGLTVGSAFKGFLVRLTGSPGLNVTGLMTVDPSAPDVQESPICINEQVGGMMHKEDSDKVEVSFKFMINEPFDLLTFDVTAVTQQNAETGVSEYYFDRFTACATDFEAPSSAPSTTPPTPSPTTAPVTPAPTTAPPTGGVLGAGQPVTTAPVPIQARAPSCTTDSGKGKGKGGKGGTTGDSDDDDECLDRADDESGKGKGGKGKGGKGDDRKRRGRRALRQAGATNNGYW